MTTPVAVVDLDAMAKPVTVRLLDAEHQVRPINAIAVKLCRGMTDENRIEIMTQVVATLVPSLTPEQIDTLAIPQLDAILGLATNGVAAVEASDPNGERPAEAASASPA